MGLGRAVRKILSPSGEGIIDKERAKVEQGPGGGRKEGEDDLALKNSTTLASVALLVGV